MSHLSTNTGIDSLHELLARVRDTDINVGITLHDVPVGLALEWVQLGLLDSVERGAIGNPPTGEMKRESEKDGVKRRVTAVVFTDGPRRQA